MSPEYKTIIAKLKEKTKAKQAIWNKTSREEEFILKMGDGSITIDTWDETKSSPKSVDLKIWNNKAIVIDSINFSYPSLDYNELKELHEIVKRNYYKVEETIHSFIEELDKKKINGLDEPEEDDLPF